MMIGVSMAASIIICIAAFIWLYTQIGPFFSDFVPEDTPEEGSGTSNIIGAASTPGAGDSEDQFELDEIEPEPMGTPDPDEDDNDATGDQTGTGDTSGDDGADATPEATPESEFEPTHQVREGPNVNFRSGPNTISQPQGALPPGTPMEFLGDEEPTGGVTWMYFEIEDGTQGWIRDIDVVEIEDDLETSDE